jgi:hypothetical protein
MRPLRPKATDRLSITPALVTDRSCAVVLGLEPREYRELVTRENVPHARRGQRTICRVEDVLVAIDRLSSVSTDTPTDDAADEGLGVDGILARIGRQRTA